jgi:S-adenosylmethionine:tRNA ribosyltransferase-isomerase
VRTDFFDFELPQELIASHPLPERDGARMLVVPNDGPVSDSEIQALAATIPPRSLLVLNDTKVVPARLLGNKLETGGKVEILLVRNLGSEGTGSLTGVGEVGEVERWRAMGKTSKAMKFPLDVMLDEQHQFFARILGRADDGLLDVLLLAPPGWKVEQALQTFGHVPLPPYMRRGDEEADKERYQTVFARVPGAIAAPTAGLHLSQALLGKLAMAEIEVVTVTLHVGLGTFQPVSVDDLDEHPMHEEWLEVPQSTVHAIAAARQAERMVFAAGTTVVRALESAADPERFGHVLPFRGPTRLLIQPGYQFRVVDGLLTNFHLPKSTLLALVAAFAGRSRILAAYEHAIAQKYRFYSYGDAMLLTGRVPAELAVQ